jgi:hypothetical protein
MEMKYEYKQLHVPVKGWTSASLSDDYIFKLNELAGQGWQVDQSVPLALGMGGTTTVVFLLKREIEK